MNGPRLALAFLTRLPGGIHPSGPSDLGRGVPWFPAIGVVVGLVVAAVYVVGSRVLTGFLAASLAVVAGMLMTGAFHEDGLADTFDAMGGTDVEQRLAIMRDSRVGTFGASALAASFLARVAAIASLPAADAWLAIPLAHAIGRGMAVALMLATPPARADGLGVGYLSDLPRRAAAVAVGLTLAAGVVSGPGGITIAIVAMVMTGVVRMWLVPKFGGITGDILGATEQLVEIAVLIAVVGIEPGGFGW